VEETNCNLCGANDAELMYIEKDRLMKVPGSFPLVRCRRCGLMYLNPRPTLAEMAQYYPEDYLPYAVPAENRASWIARVDHSYGYWKRARLIQAAYPSGGRILDVGCATGEYLRMMVRVGPWEAHGTEVSPGAAAHAREVHGLDVCTGELADARFPDSHFDVVTIWDVLEHVHDPTNTLAEIHRILRPSGLAVVRVPDGSSWDARLFGRYWVGLDAPRHTYVFSAETLSAFLQTTGFEIRSLRHVMLGYLPFALSVQFYLDDRMSDGWARHALLALNHSWIPRLLTRPLFTLLGYTNLPTFAVAAFATKPSGSGS
jgi:2-polyprenyl-3-methyl-5-hydroxy-6-metoxy-1,4-benzoquinol methylase